MAANTTPIAAFGTVVTWAGHDVGKMINVSGFSIKGDQLEITNHDSTDGFKEFVTSLMDAGEIAIEVRFIGGDTTGQKYFRDDLLTNPRPTRAVIITYPDAISKWSFNAVPSGWDGPDAPIDGVLNATMRMKISGKPTFTST